MATPVWPSTLPASPLINGYSVQRKDTKLRTNVDAGLDKVRNRYRAAPKDVTEEFNFHNNNKVAFQNFHDNTCNGGAERFIRVNPENGLTTEYRFKSEPVYNVIGFDQEGPIWNVSLSLEIMP